jgi:hypothetical protein
MVLRLEREGGRERQDTKKEKEMKGGRGGRKGGREENKETHGTRARPN